MNSKFKFIRRCQCRFCVQRRFLLKYFSRTFLSGVSSFAGVTALKSVGWYTKKEKNVLLIVARKSQMPELSKAIKYIDDKAFVSVSPASSVYGEGFDELKTGIAKKKKDDVK